IPGTGRTAGYQLGHHVGLALACGVDRFQHGGLLHHAILNEALWQAAKSGAVCAERCRSIVIHGLMASGTKRILSLPKRSQHAIVKSFPILKPRARLAEGCASHLGQGPKKKAPARSRGLSFISV